VDRNAESDPILEKDLDLEFNPKKSDRSEACLSALRDADLHADYHSFSIYRLDVFFLFLPWETQTKTANGNCTSKTAHQNCALLLHD
jgi:hypothetical protein